MNKRILVMKVMSEKSESAMTVTLTRKNARPIVAPIAMAILTSSLSYCRETYAA